MDVIDYFIYIGFRFLGLKGCGSGISSSSTRLQGNWVFNRVGISLLAFLLESTLSCYTYFIRIDHFHVPGFGMSGWVLWVFYGGVGLWG